MTREEREAAIAYIKSYRKLDENLHNTALKGSISYYATAKCLKYWDMAIQALSQEPCDEKLHREREQAYMQGYEDASKRFRQEPCDDAISRDMALEKMADYVASGYADSVEDFEEYSRIIYQLPSVTPKSETVTEFADRCRECGARYGELLKQKSGKWIPVSERLPEDTYPVNITWVNHDPEPYYAIIKDKPFTATGHYCNGRWWWYSVTCQDYLDEYGHWDIDAMDDAIEVIAWMPLPKPYEPQESEDN